MSYTKIPKYKNFTRKQVIHYVRMRIRTNDEWARKALVALDRNQTNDERRHGQAFHRNRKGFSAFDSPLLTHMAIRARKENWYHSLDTDLLKKVRHKVSKYTVQLINSANKNMLLMCLEKYYRLDPEKRGVW